MNKPNQIPTAPQILRAKYNFVNLEFDFNPPETLPEADEPASGPRSAKAGPIYRNAGCVVLLGAILFGTKPKEELLPRLCDMVNTARSLDNLETKTA